MRVVDSIARKRQILDAMRRLFVERAFQDIVLDDVAREAGVAKGTLFLYYKNKEELFAAAFADLIDQLGEAFDELKASGKKGRLLLVETVRIILGHLDRNRDFTSRFSVGRFPACTNRSTEMLMKKFKDNNRRLARLLALCREDDQLGTKELSDMAFVLFGLCRSALVKKIVFGFKNSLIDETGRTVDIFLYGVRGKK